MRGLSLVVASGGHSSLRCAGLSPPWPLLLRSTGSRRAGSVVVAHGPSCSTACGIFPDQGSNPCSLNWQADSQPLRHQGSPIPFFMCIYLYVGICLCVYVSMLGVYPSIYTCICVSVSCQFVSSFYACLYLSIYVSIYLSNYLSIYPLIYLGKRERTRSVFGRTHTKM